LTLYVPLTSAHDSPRYVELHGLKKISPHYEGYVVSILLSELKLCLPSIQDIPFIEISFNPEDGAIGFTKSIKYDKTGNRNVLSFTFTPWMNGNFNISGRILFPRLIHSRDLPLNIEQLAYSSERVSC
tara:strand:+ start:106 stop:489 length:384 start_codon:yes stop_codon:yes gene_type:complete